MLKPSQLPGAILGASSLLLLVSACHKEDPPANPDYVLGKNRFTLTSEGVQREYYVHVPATYKADVATPVVVMLHGTSGDGEKFYNISGWKEVGDTANILTVYPSSLAYCVTENGENMTTTKWNSLPGGVVFCPGQDLKNDVLFMREMLTALKSRFNVDSKRIYFVGFSNGGQFSATCAIEMSNEIAAAISCGGGGSIPRDTVLTPARLLPVMMMFGKRDDRMLDALGLPASASVPMGFEQLYSAYPFLYVVQAEPYVNNFRLDENDFTVSGDTNSVVVADYHGLSGQPNNVFKLVEVKGLEHEYPNGTNYPLHGAVYHWAWLKKYQLP